VVAVVWLFLAVASGSGEDERTQEAEGTSTSDARAPTATTPPRAPTTTTTEVILGSPLLGEGTDMELVVVGGISRVIDLDTGGVAVVRARVLGVTVHGLLVEDLEGVAVWPPPYDGSNATAMLPANPDSVIDQVWVVGDGALVWAVERADDRAVPLTSTLVDLDGNAMGRFEVPGEVWPVGATDHGLVVAGPGGLYLLDAGGDAERISTGAPLGVLGDRIYASNCDEELRCHLEVLDGAGRFVEERPSQGANNVGWATAAPDGRVALIEYNAHLGEPNLVTIDGVTVYEDHFEITGFGGMGGIAWSPDGRWLAIAVADGVHFIDTVGGVGERVVDVGLLGQPGFVLFVSPAG
jgi:hypothetical protein